MNDVSTIFKETAQRMGVDRAGGRVQRFHTNSSRNPRTTNAEHSFGVACMVLRLWSQFEVLGTWWLAPEVPRPNEELPSLEKMLKAALHHDLAEHLTGDLPAPFLARNPVIRVAVEAREAELADQHEWVTLHDLTEIEHTLVLFADRLECAVDALDRWSESDSAYMLVYDGCVRSLVAMGFMDGEDLVREYCTQIKQARITSTQRMP